MPGKALDEQSYKLPFHQRSPHRDLSATLSREQLRMGRDRLRDDEFLIWLKLNARLIDEYEAIRAMLDLMLDYYGRSLDS